MASARVSAPGENFVNQLGSLQAHAKNDADAIRGGDPPEWYSPTGDAWDGDPFDLEGIGKVFKRDKHSEEFDSAISDAKSPGTTGDLIVSTLQGDDLACMERAFRSRLRTSVRNKINAAARRYGHGQDTGIFNFYRKNYIERLIKSSNG